MIFKKLESTGIFLFFFFKCAALHAESDLHHSPYSTSNNPLFNKSVKHLYQMKGTYNFNPTSINFALLRKQTLIYINFQ